MSVMSFAAGSVSSKRNACLVHVTQEIVLQSGQGEVQVAQLEGAVKQITKFAQGSRFKAAGQVLRPLLRVQNCVPVWTRML